MKKILFLMAILPIMLFTACSSDDDTNNGDTNKFLYEIKVTEHDYKFGEVSSYGDLYEDYIYDLRGNLLKKKTNYYISAASSRIDHEYTYKYNDKNRLIEKCDYTLTLLDYKYFYSYNSIDSISEMKVYNDDGDLHETWTYEYDDAKKLVKATVIKNWLSSNFGYIHNYTYPKNKIIDTTYSIEDSSLFGIMEDEYDSYGNLINNTWTNGETEKKTQQKGITYEYNSNGQISKETSWFMFTQDLTYKNYTYNEDGVIQKIHISYSYKTSESELRYEYIHK